MGFDLMTDMTLLCGDGDDTEISRVGHPAGGSAKNRPINAMIVTAKTPSEIILIISPSLNPFTTPLPWTNSCKNTQTNETLYLKEEEIANSMRFFCSTTLSERHYRIVPVQPVHSKFPHSYQNQMVVHRILD